MKVRFRPMHAAIAASLGLTVAAAVSCNRSTTGPSATSSELSNASDGNGNSGAGPSPDSPSSGGSNSNNPSGTGRLGIRLTDSPFSEATAVLITFSEVRVHRSGDANGDAEDEGEAEASEEDGGGWETLPFAGGQSSRTCDLKQLEGPTDLLGVADLPAGHYTQIRLVVTGASIHFDSPAAAGPCAPAIAPPDAGVTVKVPSGVVKLNRPFTLASGGSTTILLDFDGDRSIIQTGAGGGNSAAPSGAGNGNGPGNAAGKGKGNGKGAKGEAEGEENDEETSSGYLLKPVITVLSVG